MQDVLLWMTSMDCNECVERPLRPTQLIMERVSGHLYVFWTDFVNGSIQVWVYASRTFRINLLFLFLSFTFLQTF